MRTNTPVLITVTSSLVTELISTHFPPSLVKGLSWCYGPDTYRM